MIDLRNIKCSCGEPNCRIGMSFDTEPNIIRFQDKYGQECVMHVNKETAKEIIDYLISFKFLMKNGKRKTN